MLALAPSPGVVYITRNIHYILLPLLTVYVSTYLLHTTLSITIPKFLVALTYISSLPLTFVSSILLREFQARRDAYLHCAELAPEVRSKAWFGYDIAMYIRHSFMNEFFVNHIFEWTQKYGPTFRTNIFGESKYYTVEPDHIKSILATDFPNFPKGDKFRFQMKAVFGSGIVNSDGDHWKYRRGLARPFLSRNRIEKFECLCYGFADEVVRHIINRNEEGYPIDFQDLAQRFTLDSTAEFVLGKNFHTLLDSLAYPPSSSKHQQPTRFSTVLAEGIKTAGVRAGFRGGLSTAWPLFEIAKDDVAEHMIPIRMLLTPVIQEALERKKHNNKQPHNIENAEEELFLDHIVDISDDIGAITDELLNHLLAGRDTTSTALTFAIYELARHEKVLRRLRQEILSIVGHTGNAGHEEIKKMKYLRAFLNEVLRLYPPIALDTRECVEPTLWPSKSGRPPIFVPKHTSILFSIFVMHRRKDLWGPDATTFDPDRFIDERLDKYLVPNPYIFLPFNAGPRVCLGQEFAYSTMANLIIRLLQNFSSIVLCQKESAPRALPTELYKQSSGTDGTDEIRIRTGLGLFVAGGLWVKMLSEEEDSEVGTHSSI